MPSRRSLSSGPTLLLSATLATVLILPWAVDSGGPRPPQAAPRIAPAVVKLNQRVLAAVTDGDNIREITQDEPFSMVALTGADLSGTATRIRAKRADGSWGPWYATAHEAASRAGHTRIGPPTGPDGTEPVYVGQTTAVQIAIDRATKPAKPAKAAKPGKAGKTKTPKTPGTTPKTKTPAKPTQPKPDLGYLPANAGQPLPRAISAVLISPPKAPVDAQWMPPAAVLAPGQPPNVIPRSHWGGAPINHCGYSNDGGPVHAAVVHHTAGSNDYDPEDSAGIVRAIYAYHTRTLGWCDIGYNALVDKYGQVFEGRAGGLARPVTGSHAGGFNRDTWGVSMLGTFDDTPPPPIQLQTVGRLLGWRLSLDQVDPRGNAQLASGGGSYTHFPRGASLTLPVIVGHRDLDSTECPGDTGYAALDEIRDIAARFNEPPGPQDILRVMEGGAIHTRWLESGGFDGPLGGPTSPEAVAEGTARYATFEHGALYWSPETGAHPLTGAIYDAWAALGYERGALGLPTSAEIPEPEWVGQNFQHGTLNFDRASGTVTRVVDGVAEVIPPPAPEGPPVQLERFSKIIDLAPDA